MQAAEDEPLKGNILAIMDLASIIARMIGRLLKKELEYRLANLPAVVLLGPRQVGKTTLALQLSGDALYLDLESEQDRSRLEEAELYLSTRLQRPVILDEVHRQPGLFPVLRGLIDQARREGKRTNLYLLLGSASLDLLRQSGESLAGRVSYLELTPFTILEIRSEERMSLWVRGGFPESFLSRTDALSDMWRRDFIRTYLEREIPQFGSRISGTMLRRFWTMLAHLQGELHNAAHLARNLGIDGKTVASYLDLLVDLFLVRRLPAYHTNAGKRLVRSPRIYIRDSGVLHSLLAIPDHDTLLSHPVLGASWEGFVIENLLAHAPADVQPFFYRTAGGAEIDLLLVLPDGKLWAIEIKHGLKPRPEKGFYSACDDLKPERQFVVYSGDERYPLSREIEAISLTELSRMLLEMREAAFS